MQLNLLFQQYVFWFEIAVNESSFVEQTQPIQKLLSKDSNKCRTETSELILLYELV